MDFNGHRTIAFEWKHAVVDEANGQVKQVPVVFSSKDCSLSLVSHSITNELTLSRYLLLNITIKSMKKCQLSGSEDILLDFSFPKQVSCHAQIYSVEHYADSYGNGSADCCAGEKIK